MSFVMSRMRQKRKSCGLVFGKREGERALVELWAWMGKIILK